MCPQLADKNRTVSRGVLDIYDVEKRGFDKVFELGHTPLYLLVLEFATALRVMEEIFT
jgi:hypothetical protein